MPFWSRQRLLRGALTPRHACTIVALASAQACLAYLAAVLPPVGVDGRLDPAWLALPAAAITAGLLTLAAFVDSVCQILPDPLLALAASAALIYALATGSMVAALATGGAAAGLAYAVSALSGMGRGDAKLCGVIGLWLADPPLTAAALLVATGAAGTYALAMACAGAIGRHSTLALGPWLVGAACLAWYADVVDIGALLAG
ncbi:MAG: prepilin peptidase [Actinomycetaceae bacterium]|nr:prepilin peptidase [Actinomycetaceae bacterium]